MKKLLEELRIYMEKNANLIAKPEDVIEQTKVCLEFFKEKLEKEEPQAKVTINALEHIIEYLDIHL
jgi:hypothetical protein